MTTEQVRIGIRGRIGDATARSLGGSVEDTPDGFELVVPYVDVAQLTGLLVRLGDLYIPFHHVHVTPIDASNTDTNNTNNTDTSNSNSNEGATS